jgi:hypothetical protein
MKYHVLVDLACFFHVGPGYREGALCELLMWVPSTGRVVSVIWPKWMGVLLWYNKRIVRCFFTAGSCIGRDKGQRDGPSFRC